MECIPRQQSQRQQPNTIKNGGSKPDHFVCYPICFVGCPWLATADLVRGRVSTTNVVCGRVSSHIAAGLPPLSLVRLDLPVSGGFDEDDHHARACEDGVFHHLVTVNVHVTLVYHHRHTFYSHALLRLCPLRQSPRLAGPNSA